MAGKVINYLDRVKGLDKNLKKAQAEYKDNKSLSSDGPDDGNYKARLEKIEVGPRSDQNKEICLKSQFKLVGGDFDGHFCFRSDSLEREDGLPYVLKYLRQLGAEDVEEIDKDKLDSELKRLNKEKPGFRIRLKTKADSEFQNLYIQKPIDLDDEDDKPSKSKKTKDDEDDNDDKGDSDTGRLDVGDEIKWEDDGDEREGKVVAVDEDKERYRVKLEDGEKVYVSFADVKSEDDGDDDKDNDEAPAFEDGDAVSWVEKGKWLNGKIVAINERKHEATVKDADGDKQVISLDDLTQGKKTGKATDDNEDDEKPSKSKSKASDTDEEIAPGDTVIVKDGKKKRKATVVGTDKKTGGFKVQFEDDDSKGVADADACTKVDD